MKTAVEWLVEQLDGERHLTENEIKRLIQQAKEMEKEQIMDAHHYGKGNGIDISRLSSITKEIPSEQYYNETFKNK
jgi:hypothetical protein